MACLKSNRVGVVCRQTGNAGSGDAGALVIPGKKFSARGGRQSVPLEALGALIIDQV
jgi:hypothetical protein